MNAACRPLRVLLFCNGFLPHKGGLEFVVHYLAESLIDLGADVTVLAKRRKERDDFQHRYRLERFGATFPGAYRIGLNRLSAGREIRRLHRIYGFDVANVHGASMAASLGLRPILAAGVPVLLTPHGEDVQTMSLVHYGARLNPVWNKRVSASVVQATAVSAISDSIRDTVLELGARSVVSIPNGVHLNLFSPEKTSYLTEKLGLSPGTRIVLSVGQNRPVKGYEWGLRAFAEMLSKSEGHSAVHYVLVGKGSSRLAATVEQLGISDRVSLLEGLPPSEISQCYRSATVLFCPSLIEGLSLVCIEAMACGLPIVASDVPGNRDVVRANGCGITVPSMNPRGMAEGLWAALSDSDSLRRFASAGVAGSKKYGWQCIAAEYLHAYEALRNHRTVHADAMRHAVGTR